MQEMSQGGTPIAEIAAATGFSIRTVQRYLREAGEKGKTPGRPTTIPELLIPELRQRYLAGEITVSEIARQYGVSTKTVRRNFAQYAKLNANRFVNFADTDAGDGGVEGDGLREAPGTEE